MRDEDDEQLHPPTTSVEVVDTVVASETTGTDIVFDVVEDTHRDEARDEDNVQPHPPTASAEEVGTLAATYTDVVVDVVEDPHCGEARDDADDADDYYWSYDDDDEVLDVDHDDDDEEECEVVTPSWDPISKHPSNEEQPSINNL